MIAHNKLYDAGEETWYQAINQFSDMTSEEFQDTVLDREGWKARNAERAGRPEPEATPARLLRRSKGGTVDWRKKGAVTPVKNQGQCGSCWTFSATGSIEGVHFLANHKLTSFSEQQIVSCCHVNGAAGCNGGIMDSAFQYVKKFGGLATESSYPYKSGGGNSGRCNTKGKDVVKDVLSGYTARHDSAEEFCRLNARLCTAMAWIFIPAHCFCTSMTGCEIRQRVGARLRDQEEPCVHRCRCGQRLADVRRRRHVGQLRLAARPRRARGRLHV